MNNFKIQILIFSLFLFARSANEGKNSTKKQIPKKTTECNQNDLLFLRQFYVRYQYESGISLLTNFDEINNKMCRKIIVHKQFANFYIFQIFLSRTEQFSNQQFCTIAFQFRDYTNQDKKPYEIEPLQENGETKLLFKIPLKDEKYILKTRCEKLLENESDSNFENRLLSKIKTEKVSQQIQYMITQKIQEAPESFASTVLVPNEKLQEALTKEAFVQVLYERFNCLPQRIHPFKNVISKSQVELQNMVSIFLKSNEKVFKKIYDQQSKEFKNKLETQLANKLGQVTNNVIIGGVLEEVCPGLQGDLSQGIAQSMVGFVFELIFTTGTQIVGSIVNNTVGRIYQGILGYFVHNQNSKRNFQICQAFPELKIQDVLDQKVHGILDFTVKHEDVKGCFAEKIEINNAFLGYEVNFQISGPRGLCTLNVFINQGGVINYLYPKDPSEGCANYNPNDQGDLVDSISNFANSNNQFSQYADSRFNKEVSGLQSVSMMEQIQEDFKEDEDLKSHPIQFDQMELEEISDIESSNEKQKLKTNDELKLI